MSQMQGKLHIYLHSHKFNLKSYNIMMVCKGGGLQKLYYNDCLGTASQPKVTTRRSPAPACKHIHVLVTYVI